MLPDVVLGLPLHPLPVLKLDVVADLIDLNDLRNFLLLQKVPNADEVECHRQAKVEKRPQDDVGGRDEEQCRDAHIIEIIHLLAGVDFVADIVGEQLVALLRHTGVVLDVIENEQGEHPLALKDVQRVGDIEEMEVADKLIVGPDQLERRGPPHDVEEVALPAVVIIEVLGEGPDVGDQLLLARAHDPQLSLFDIFICKKKYNNNPPITLLEQ